MTALMRWDPTSELRAMRSRMDELLSSLFPQEDGVVLGAFSPALDVEEEDDAYVVHVEVPGIPIEDIEVSLEDDTLRIQGERKFYEDKEQDGFRRIERRYGRFHRVLRLPTPVKEDGVVATAKDGMLTVTVPKREEAKRKLVEIKAAA